MSTVDECQRRRKQSKINCWISFGWIAERSKGRHDCIRWEAGTEFRQRVRDWQSRDRQAVPDQKFRVHFIETEEERERGDIFFINTMNYRVKRILKFRINLFGQKIAINLLFFSISTRSHLSSCRWNCQIDINSSDFDRSSLGGWAAPRCGRTMKPNTPTVTFTQSNHFYEL